MEAARSVAEVEEERSRGLAVDLSGFRVGRHFCCQMVGRYLLESNHASIVFVKNCLGRCCPKLGIERPNMYDRDR